ncbi:lipocalin family protein [Hufsiella ginkgonis]|uniref:Lipocalin-like domain-containing protein n=1 Tax=Hufsiella ginkgonis TaxID=2695274 RepID=A0A7K1Y1V4_9SPHI|nr:lipocalin family protein [Hufsiella ginkgonis]MXV16666.1 hypothetical protein [Hufsiella ginkgonis]
MKNVKLHLSAACMALFMLVSCSGGAAKKLAKTWTVSNIQTATALPDSVTSKMLAGSEMAFTGDGNYNVTGGIGADQGTYTVDKDAKNLSTTSTAGKENAVYTIEKLTDDELVLKNQGNTITCTAKK